jgi:hypothetical protein
MKRFENIRIDVGYDVHGIPVCVCYDLFELGNDFFFIAVDGKQACKNSLEMIFISKVNIGKIFFDRRMCGVNGKSNLSHL